MRNTFSLLDKYGRKNIPFDKRLFKKFSSYEPYPIILLVITDTFFDLIRIIKKYL